MEQSIMDDLNRMKAIPTKYKGYTFRSKLEAKWAVFFDYLDLSWEYEPDGYKLNDGTYYLPDFKVFSKNQSHISFYEVKPNYIKSDEKFNKFREFIVSNILADEIEKQVHSL